jgi:hypothetical protein
MMTLQARETLKPYIGNHHPLRAYPVNSPRAKARLIVLALLADGRLDEREMTALNRRGAFATLGISREDFVQVMQDFCSDVAGLLPVSSGSFQLTPETLAGLFGEVEDPECRQNLKRMIVSVISCDGHLSDAEDNLFRISMECWKPAIGKGQQAKFVSAMN